IIGSLTTAVQNAVPLVLIYILSDVPAVIIAKSANFFVASTGISAALVGALAPTLLAVSESTLQEKTEIKRILGESPKVNSSPEKAEKQFESHIGFTKEKKKFKDYVELYVETGGNFCPTKEIICYSGEPGTGKTTFVQTLNQAMGRGKLQIIPCAGIKKFNDYSILGDENKPKKIEDEQIQRDLIKLFDLYQNKEGEDKKEYKSKKLFDKYYQMEIELDHITFFATVNFPQDLVPLLKNGVVMRGIESGSALEKALLPIFDPYQNTKLFSEEINLSDYILLATSSTRDMGQLSAPLTNRLDCINVETAEPKKFFLDNCYRDKEQEYLDNYWRVWKETEKEGLIWLKKDENDCCSKHKDQNGKVLKQKDCYHCQPWKFPNNDNLQQQNPPPKLF
ncbi:8268_t:CDS:2, partial [Ambispora gerdemannii]